MAVQLDVKTYVPSMGQRVLLAEDKFTTFLRKACLRVGSANHPRPRENLEVLISPSWLTKALLTFYVHQFDTVARTIRQSLVRRPVSPLARLLVRSRP